MMCSSRARAVAELALPTMGGVTHLKFAPNGRLLFSGSRKDAAIVCWDIRRTKEVSELLLIPGAMHCLSTKQRMGVMRVDRVTGTLD